MVLSKAKVLSAVRSGYGVFVFPVFAHQQPALTCVPQRSRGVHAPPVPRDPSCMTSVVPPSLVAALADRYRIDRELGAGGMATV